MRSKITTLVISKVFRMAVGNTPPSICYGINKGSQKNCICDCYDHCKFSPNSTSLNYSHNKTDDGVYDAYWPIKDRLTTM